MAVPYRLLEHGEPAGAFGTYQAALAFGAAAGAQIHAMRQQLTHHPARSIAAGALCAAAGVIIVSLPGPT